MSPTSYRAAPPRDDPRSVPDAGESVNNSTTLSPRRARHVAVSRVSPLTAGGQILRLHRGDLVRGDAVLRQLRLEGVDARGVAREDRALHRTFRAAERLEAVLLLHVLGNLETAHRLDLPLGRAVPERVRAPDDVVGAEALHQRPDEGRGEARVGDGGGREGRADLAVDVLHAELAGDLGQVARPLDLTGLLELGQRRVGRLQEVAERAVIDHEVELRPVLGGLAQVPDRRVLPHLWPRGLVVGGQQSLVDADRVDARLRRLLVERIDELLVVEPPVRLELGRKEWIADRVALPAVRLERRDGAVDLLHPAVLLRREHGMAEQAP